MEELVLSARRERWEITRECYEALGCRLTCRKEEGDNQDYVTLTFVREKGTGNPGRQARCEAILREIEKIDAKAHRFFLQWDVFVGMVGAGFIALSIVSLTHHLQILFTVFLLIGITGCTIPLGLRPFLLKLGLKKYGAALPDLLKQLEEQMEQARKEGDPA